MKILVVGSGGREHALAWKLAQSPRVRQVFVAPGNGGTALAEDLRNVPIEVMDFKGLAEFALGENIALTIVGPEAPLVEGIQAYFSSQGLACLAPTAEAAQLEGSKSYAKDFLKRNAIPTAESETFTEIYPAQQFARGLGLPVVIKADGLAAGKGVVVAQSEDEADQAIQDMLSGNAFGEAGSKVVVEAFLPGEEASFIVLADGEDYLVFASSQDHKAIYDGDQGPNTGGMGAYSPAPVVTDEVRQRVCEKIIAPTLAGLTKVGIRYTGFLYAGLMIDEDGNPRVIEFNCRFGDPETQPIMLRLESDLAEVCLAAVEHRLKDQQLIFTEEPALAVVVASAGYPQRYETGALITGLDEPRQSEVFHAGTALVEGELRVSGGRVVALVAKGASVSEAQAQVYRDLKQLQFAGRYFRTDIGYRAIAREQH